MKSQLLPWQTNFLRELTIKQNPTTILEIGTLDGASAITMAKAAPAAVIITLNPAHNEVIEARKNLAAYPNVEVVEAKSWDYISVARIKAWDMIFVDGDHKQFRQDIPWFNLLKPGGLFLCHDFGKPGTEYACEPVYYGIGYMEGKLGRPCDVCMTADDGSGMAGFYRNGTERV